MGRISGRQGLVSRLKSRPSFRALLADRVPGIAPPLALRRSRFLDGVTPSAAVTETGSDDLNAFAAAKRDKLGFDAIGVARRRTRSRTPAPRLTHFLGAGRHGDMAWMARQRRAARRSAHAVARSALGRHARHELRAARAIRSTRSKTPTRGAISVYAQGRDYHDVLKAKLKQLARAFAAASGAEVKVFVDTAPLMEKPLAAAAGLGWQGKHTNLVSRAARLVAVPRRHPHHRRARSPTTPEADHCGSCRRCLDVCPTAAFPGALPARCAPLPRLPVDRAQRPHRGRVPPRRWATACSAATTASPCARGTSSPPPRAKRALRRAPRPTTRRSPSCSHSTTRLPRALCRHAGQAHGPRPLRAQRADRRRQLGRRWSCCAQSSRCSAMPRRSCAPWPCGPCASLHTEHCRRALRQRHSRTREAIAPSRRVDMRTRHRDMSRLFCFGLGYSAQRVGRRLARARLAHRAARRDHRAQLRGHRRHRLRGLRVRWPSPRRAMSRGRSARATHVLLSIPPEADGDPAFLPSRRRHRCRAARCDGSAISRPSASTATRRAPGSTRQRRPSPHPSAARGASPPRTNGASSRQRTGKRVDIFRLPGIYGPGRSAIDGARGHGAAHRQAGSSVQPHPRRRHRGRGLAAIDHAGGGPPTESTTSPTTSRRPPQDVVAYAARLLGIEPPPDPRLRDRRSVADGPQFLQRKQARLERPHETRTRHPPRLSDVPRRVTRHRRCNLEKIAPAPSRYRFSPRLSG